MTNKIVGSPVYSNNDDYYDVKGQKRKARKSFLNGS